MTVKKVALLGLASVATLGVSLSMAGGPAACAPAADVSGVYVGVDLGTVYNTEFDLTRVEGTITAIDHTKQTPWGFTASGIVGYQYNNNWALQFGYIWYKDQELILVTPSILEGKFSHYNLYLGVKGMLPIIDQISAYMMIGPAYSHASIKNSGSLAGIANKGRGTNWVPMGALGLSYRMDESFNLNLEYMFLFGDTRSVQAQADESSNRLIADANTQRITVGATYLFAM
jgi:opacity protein-like surface antigen